jgi:AraC family transcriptional regulator
MDRSPVVRAETKVESPARWYARLSRPQVKGELTGAILRCFDGTDPTIEQPALDENIVAIHLGGAKRVNRWQGRMHQTWDVPSQAITLMPAFRANRWHTDGVIAFAHLTLSASLIARLAREEFDRDPGEIALLDKVGIVDPLLSELMLALGREVAEPGLRRIYRDSLLTTLGITVLRRHSSLVRDANSARTGSIAKGGLTGWQLRRVLDHMAAHMLNDVGLDELVDITGLSRAQFFRAFRKSTGQTPGRQILQLRMQHAANLLEQGRVIDEIAGLFGYSNSSHFAAAFRRYNGANPSEWRRFRKAVGMDELP